MKQNKGTKIAYTAGVIDSDGCISIGYQKPNNYDLTILLNSPDGRIIDFLYGCWGGSIYKTKAYQTRKDGTNGRDVWRWELKGDKVMWLCKRMIPFLRYKKEQAQIAVQFQTHKNKGIQISLSGIKYRTCKLLSHEIEFRANLYKKMRSLKQIFVKPRAVVETK